MRWVKSRLFWKILGLYALLSLIALTGLLVTLNMQLSSRAEVQQQTEVLRTLRAIRTELAGTEDPQFVISLWQKMLQRERQPLWLVDENGHTLTPVTEQPPEGTTTESVIRTALTTGQSMRRVHLRSGSPEVLAFALDASPATSSPRALLTTVDLRSLLKDDTATTEGATRAAFFTWLIGILCVAFVAAGIVSPLQEMSLNLDSSIERTQRENMLLAIADRHDELGQVADSLHRLEEDRRQRIERVELAEREARSSADLLSAVLDSMVEGVVAVDMDQRIVFLNRGARRLLGISNVIGVGHRLYEAVRVSVFLDTVKEAVTAGTMQSLEYRTTQEHATLAVVVIPILKGPHAGAVAVVRDISEIRRLEAMRRDFVSAVSHELKTPLTVIQACTDTLLGGAMSDPAAAERFLNQIAEQSERLLQLILGMLQLARVESGQQVLHIESVDVHTLAEEVLRGFHTVADAKSIQLSLAGAAELSVVGDHQAIQTILSNLVDNALKHTDAGGSVTVQLMNDESAPSFLVRDTGSGIPEELQDRIFERFYRVDRDRSRERGGTGLGLAIVKHLCHALGASASVKSQIGKGSEFKVTFRRS